MKTQILSKFIVAIIIAAITSISQVTAGENLPLVESVKKVYVTSDRFAADTSEIALMSSGIKFNSYLKSNIRYPALAVEKGIEGSVRVLCEIGTDGLVKDIKVLSAVDEMLAKEVIKAANKMSFIPATQNGFAVSYSIIIPVKFDLE